MRTRSRPIRISNRFTFFQPFQHIVCSGAGTLTRADRRGRPDRKVAGVMRSILSMVSFGKRLDGPGGRRTASRKPAFTATGIMTVDRSQVGYLLDVSAPAPKWTVAAV